MPYARTNWTAQEIERALANPYSASAGPAAHSSKHGVSGELAEHPLFQRARVTAQVIDDKHRESNAVYHLPGSGASNNFKKNHPAPSPEASTHSTMGAAAMADALRRAFNNHAMQAHLATLDAGNDMKVNVNFLGAPIGGGRVHGAGGSAPAQMVSLFVYCKPNPGNRDIPIFQTVVPFSAPKGPGGLPLVTI